MMAKDHLNPKKSSGVSYSFLPQLFVNVFDKEVDQINRDEIITITNALSKHVPVKELLTIGEGGYASYLIQIAFQLCQAEAIPILEKFTTSDNMTFAHILRNPIQQAPLNRKLLVDLVKHYGTRPEAAEHIA